ncbi:hypothetical protein CPC08DRAFT_767192 [Agrocybe pediades]|nr:hypothetical protein CPC08DRAFT_767192 [Agrocybe pediades]
MQSCDEYARPRVSAAYSREHLASLTFEYAANNAFPTIQRPGYILRWSFSPEVPLSARSTVILPGEIIPHIEDFQPILKIMDTEYKRGARSVLLFIKDDEAENQSYLVHFCKIRLFVNINNEAKAFRHAQELVRHLERCELLPETLYTRLLKERISAPICGFKTAAFPLSELGCLRNEIYVEEEVANALLELRYFKMAAASFDKVAHFLLLPTLNA